MLDQMKDLLLAAFVLMLFSIQNSPMVAWAMPPLDRSWEKLTMLASVFEPSLLGGW